MKLYEFGRDRSQIWSRPLFTEPQIIKINTESGILDVFLLPAYDFRLREVICMAYVEPASRFPQPTIVRIQNRLQHLPYLMTEIDVIEERSPNMPLRIVPRSFMEQCSLPTQEELEDFARWYISILK